MHSETDAPGPTPGRDFTGPGTDAGVPPPAPLHAILHDPTAFEERAEALRRQRPGFPDPDRPAASLLDALVWFFKLPTRQNLLEATATARRPMADVEDEEARLVGEELDRARESLADFELGLRLARAAGAGELTLDSGEPELDRIAGALIANLVATDFATVRTEDSGDRRYLYHVAVDWPRLDAFAARLDLPLPSRLD